MTENEISEIEARANAATPGPWNIDLKKTNMHNGYIREYSTGDELIVETWCGAQDGHAMDNAEFIAHAREDIPKLLAEVRKLREWKRKHQGVGLRDDDEFACINKCIPWNYSFDFRSLPGETIKHSPDCPDFTVDGELK